jgi:hypothetical protein
VIKFCIVSHLHSVNFPPKKLKIRERTGELNKYVVQVMKLNIDIASLGDVKFLFSTSKEK